MSSYHTRGDIGMFKQRKKDRQDRSEEWLLFPAAD
jgi:hypothetical protein